MADFSIGETYLFQASHDSLQDLACERRRKERKLFEKYSHLDVIGTMDKIFYKGIFFYFFNLFIS